jgi:hypothetical protein
MDEDDVENRLEELFEFIPNLDKFLLLGDLNCRLDIDTGKGEYLKQFAVWKNLKIGNDYYNEKTFICWNGSSTVDVILHGQDLKKSRFSLLYGHYKSHLPIVFEFEIDIVGLKADQTKRRSRYFDENLLSQNIHFLRQALCQALEDDDIEKFNFEIKKFVDENRKIPSNLVRASKDWYDKECRDRKQALIRIGFSTVNKKYDTVSRRALLDSRKEYKQLCNEKRVRFEEKRVEKLIAEAEDLPYKILKLNRTTCLNDNLVDMEIWEKHFNSILNLSNADSDESLNFKELLNNYDEDLITRPIIEAEVRFALGRLKNKKAAGPDEIYNEQLKIICPLIMPQLIQFLNLCLNKGKIPESWKVSKLKVLFKGKGDREDVNSYRGISIGSCLFNLLDKILYVRVFAHFHDSIPDNQFGFIPQRNTLQAIEKLLNKIMEHLQSGKMLYVVFLDLYKAFDSLDRLKIFQTLMNKKCLSKGELSLIAECLDLNFLILSDGVYQSERILQSNGIRQGAASSPLFFDISVADVDENFVEINESVLKEEEVDALFFADDGAIFSANLTALQRALNKVGPYYESKGLKINTEKTKVLKFRLGGKEATSDKIFYNNKEIEFVNNFCYLGVILQTTGRCFTKHIDARARAARFASYDLKSLNKMSISAALKLFDLKVAPMAHYGIQCIWKYLKTSDFQNLESVKSRYLKRAMNLSKFALSRYTYWLADTTFFVHDIKLKFDLPETDCYKEFMKLQFEKMLDVPLSFFQTHAFSNQSWKGPLFDKRHIFTRFAVHGFHYLICTDKSFHFMATEDCICSLCKGPCSQHHLATCPKRVLPLEHYAKIKPPSQNPSHSPT